MSLATPSALGMGDYSWRFSLGGSSVPSANWAAARLPVNGGFGGALTNIEDAGEPAGVFDRAGGGEGGLGSNLSGNNSEVAASASSKSASTETTFAPGRSFNVGRKTATAVNAIGTAVGAPMGLGLAFSAAGVGYDQYTANKDLARNQTPQLGFGDYLSGFINSISFGAFGTPVEDAIMNNYLDYWGPAGLDPMVDPNYAGFSPYGGMGFADPIGTGMDAFGGWGGYGGMANQGAGADIEGEPGMSQADIDAIDGFDSWGSFDSANDEDNEGGYDDWGGEGGYE